MSEIKTVKIEHWAKQYKPAEIYSVGPQFSLVSRDLKQISTLVLCKDFITDSIRSKLYNRKESIYSYSISPEESKDIDLENLRVIFANAEDKKFLEKIPCILDFLNQIEDKLGFQKTEVFSIENPIPKYNNGMLVLVADRQWQIAPPMWSYFSLLLRCSCVHSVGNTYEQTLTDLISGKIKPYQDNDTSYMTTAKVGLDKIIKYGWKTYFSENQNENFPESVNISYLHERGGCVSWCNGSSSAVNKNWRDKWDKEETEVKKEEVKPVKKPRAKKKVVDKKNVLI